MTTLTEENLKYNFVFLFAGEDYWRAILGKELYHGPKSRVYRTALDGSSFLQKLFHYHWAYSINSRVNLPFKKLWFKRMYNQDFDNGLPLCFIFMGGNNARFDGGFCDYVRKMDSQNKIVILHMDLISKKCNYDYEEIRKKADLIITYDENEAREYGIEYYPDIIYSKLIPEPDKVDFKYDVYFLGAAKDRLEKIHEAYEFFTGNGFKCKFVVVGVPVEKRIEEIEYSDGIPYEENLRNIIKSRHILEISQGGATGITMRALEAISYKRKFISNCGSDIKEYFNEGQLLQFKEIEDIDVNFLKEGFDVEDFNPVVDLNPLKRLYFIQDKLEKLNEK